MRSKFSRIVIALALLVCVACPVLEAFDHWDHTLQTGNDTEYAMVVLALCVGALYSVAHSAVQISDVNSDTPFERSECSIASFLPAFHRSFDGFSIPLSPPPILELRV